MKSILDRSIPDIARLVSQGEVSAEEVTRLALERIERLNGLYGAFLTVQAEQALDEARAVDAQRARGQRLGALAGVPIGLKDALCTRDAPTTAGSLSSRAPARPQRDAARAIRAARAGARPTTPRWSRGSARRARCSRASATWTSSRWARRPRRARSSR